MNPAIRLARAALAFGYTFFDGSYERPNERPYLPTTTGSASGENITQGDVEPLANISAKLFANYGPVMGCYNEIVMFAIGKAWKPVFTGEDVKWGDKAEVWSTKVWSPSCDIAGDVNFNTKMATNTLQLLNIGEFFELKTYDEFGFPCLQHLPAHRIAGNKDITEGPYAGCEIKDGIVKNNFGRVVGYNYVSSEINTPDYIFSASSVIHVYDKTYAQFGRGIPTATHALEELRDAKQSSDWEKQNYLASSTQSILEYNDKGMPDVGGIGRQLIGSDTSTKTLDANGNVIEKPTQAAAPLRPAAHAKLFGGMVRYFRANAGHKLEHLVNTRPGKDWDDFSDRLLRYFYTGANWPMELSWKHDGLNGPGTYVLLEKARVKIVDVQSIMEDFAIAAHTFAISVAIELEELPMNKEFLEFSFTLPPILVGNQSKDRDQSRRDYFAGIDNLSDQLHLRGKRARPHLRQRAREEQMKDEVAAEFNIPVARLGTDNPNGAFAAPAPEDDKEAQAYWDKRQDNK